MEELSAKSTIWKIILRSEERGHQTCNYLHGSVLFPSPLSITANKNCKFQGLRHIQQKCPQEKYAMDFTSGSFQNCLKFQLGFFFW